ncbi:hypothetical protein [Stenotrophomonas sp. PS02297]|uniref:hypothetical protein n=1 Tax=Stenotrophomonas sp. PS02297 TaxID=2991423 RepID=UPI00249C2E95|nr:hypothetical protein [Stenotrophomonas sp. PS02297]
MIDDQQRARELLADSYEKLGEFTCAAITRSGRHEHRAALEAIAAALRATPEGFVMVPVEPTEEMNRAGAVHVSNPYGLARDVWSAMLAARPQGVKDA